MSTTLINRIGRRSWTDEDVAKYIGSFRSTYLSYATDEVLRRRSASGGSTTALLTHLLKTGQIDGAMVVRGWVDGDAVIHADFEIATTPDELIAAQGSKYQAVRFGQRELTMIEEFPGRLGIVLLPCDASTLANVRKRRPSIDEKIELVISLYCGHNSEPELVQSVAAKIGKGRGKLTDFHYRSGHWRGVLTAQYEDGSEQVVHHNEFKNYFNLYFCAQRKCNHCNDHFGYTSDLSVGDIWTLSMREHPIKHTAVITRSERGEEALLSAVDAEAIHRQPVDVRDVLDGQSRTLPTHYNVSARAKVGRLFGYKIKDSVGERVRIRDLIVAFLMFVNQRVGRSRIGRRIVMALPRPVVRAYLMLFKAFEQL